MFLPSQGFRHAVTLLLTNRVRAIPTDASPDVVQDELIHLADELVALAADMHVAHDAAAWVKDEYGRTIERLPCAFDIQSVRASASRVIDRIGSGGAIRRSDLFLVYVPEDRLPIAAPLAIALTKHRLSVAFSPYEVTTPAELRSAIDSGLARHVAGIIVCTRAFERAGLREHVMPHERLRVVTAQRPPVEELVNWSRRLRPEVPSAS